MIKHLLSVISLALLVSCSNNKAGAPGTPETPTGNAATEANQPHDSYWHKADIRNKDSLAYSNFAAGNPSFTFSDTPNNVTTTNGLKFTVKRISFTELPTGYKVAGIDSSEDRNDQYRLAVVEIEAKNTSGQVLKFEAMHPSVSGISLYAAETGWRPFHYSSDLSMGNLYLKTNEPEKSGDVFKLAGPFFSRSYNSGETRNSGNSLVYIISAHAKTFDRMVLSCFEPAGSGSWASVNYACPLHF